MSGPASAAPVLANGLQVQLLSESNSLLREENQRNMAAAAEHAQQAKALQEALGPLQAQVRERDALAAAQAQEVAAAQAESARWQQRVAQLLEKYKAIDLDEHRRVQAQLQEAQVRGPLPMASPAGWPVRLTPTPFKA